MSSSTGSDGKSRTWLWFRATKPMVSAKNGHPEETQGLRDSVFMFAVPTLKVGLLENT